MSAPAPDRGYRPEIDGLRAIAVLAVLLFHARVPGFGGGFVGVDVFFVISGYLITGILLEDLRLGRFSIARFYERRVRRIFPALFIVLAACLAAGVALLGPRDLERLSRDASATAVFVSNVFQWLEQGYFAPAAETEPLLHTWSLAIEEQFYILFPLLLLLISRVARGHYARWIGVVAIASLILCIRVTADAPSTAFYMMPHRAWQLLIGSLLACRIVAPVRSAAVRSALGAVGVAAILLAVVFLSEGTRYPGSAALLPTVGAALVLFSTEQGSWVASALGTQALTFVGLISYSLYLWHWPLLVFARLIAIRELHAGETIAVLLASVALATLTWRWVETPFRTRPFTTPRRRVLAAAAVPIAIVMGVGLVIQRTDGLPGRFDSSLAQLTEPDSEWTRWGRCQATSEDASAHDSCALGPAGRTASFLLWGDSNARALATAVHESALRTGVGGELAGKFTCPPLLGVEPDLASGCVAFNDTVLAFVRAHPELETVVLTGRWAFWALGTRYKSEHSVDGDAILVDVHAGSPIRDLENEVVFARGLGRTVSELTKLGRRVVIVSSIPEIGYEVGSLVFVAQRTHRDANGLMSPTVAEYAARNEAVLRALNGLPATDRVTILDPWKSMCASGTCWVIQDGQILYRDDDHLSTAGSRFVSPLFDAVLAPVLRQP